MSLKPMEKFEIGRWGLTSIISIIVFAFGYVTSNIKTSMSAESKIEMTNYRIETILEKLDDIKEIKETVNKLATSTENTNTIVKYHEDRITKLEDEVKELKK